MSKLAFIQGLKICSGSLNFSINTTFACFISNIEGIHRLKQSLPKRKVGFMAKSYDPIAPIAEEISQEASLLCFDEFQVKWGFFLFFLDLFLYFKLYVYMCQCMCVHTHRWGCVYQYECSPRPETLGPRDLSLQVAVSCMAWVQGTELRPLQKR